jgi:hypothetical protein
MPELTAKRTLVKSPPELWEELSEVERLAKHLGAFGEIKITKLGPEHTVAWEGEHASGTVSIEQSGWGTRVTLTAELAEEHAEAAPIHDAEAGPEPGEMEPPPDDSPADVQAADPDPPEAPNPEPDQPVGTEPPPRALSPGPTEQPRGRRGVWQRLIQWFVGDEVPRSIAPAPAAATDNAPEAPVSADIKPDAPAVEPVVEKSEAGVAAVPREPAVASVPATQLPEDEPATNGAGVPTQTDEPSAIDAEQAQMVLNRTLDVLGSAHHRPFSRG